MNELVSGWMGLCGREGKGEGNAGGHWTLGRAKEGRRAGVKAFMVVRRENMDSARHVSLRLLFDLRATGTREFMQRIRRLYPSALSLI